MYEGNAVDLQMEKVIAADAILDDETHHCQVFRYDMEEDYIYLQLKEDDLTAISLDAKYQCYISTRTELLFCTGVVPVSYTHLDVYKRQVYTIRPQGQHWLEAG